MTQAEILNRLRASGYRLTPQRRKLVDVLLRAEGPLTAEEIHQRARQARTEADLSTIYRNLATFCEMGWLDALPGANGERFYQIHDEREQTMSVLCLDCGRLTPVSAPTGPLNEAVRGMGFNADSLRVTLAAHCGEHVCPRKEK
jgi:Fe2+ or Zn2+ uptake regulation protein